MRPKIAEDACRVHIALGNTLKRKIITLCLLKWCCNADDILLVLGCSHECSNSLNETESRRGFVFLVLLRQVSLKLVYSVAPTRKTLQKFKSITK